MRGLYPSQHLPHKSDAVMRTAMETFFSLLGPEPGTLRTRLKYINPRLMDLFYEPSHDVYFCTND